jgi:uncharacterized alkaline shock family protein YloU/adenylate kinase family enzyme
MFNWFQSIVWTFKRVKVYALVGRSGTGKSFRAKLVAEKYQIPLIIDDGLLIQGQKILCGLSAKQAQNYLVAVKTAIFDEPSHLKEVTETLQDLKFKKILLIGTSQKMVKLIAKRLRLPNVAKFISIEDVSTQEEIQMALNSRSKEGKHVIPVPAMEVKRDYGHILLDSVKIFFQKWAKKGKIIEKAVVRPEFHDQGKISISDSALGQMVLHCVDEFDHTIDIEKVTVVNLGKSFKINLFLAVDYGLQLSGTFNELQQYIITSIQRYTGILVEEVNIRISKIGSTKKKEKKR